jgi:hypothetical protein
MEAKRFYSLWPLGPREKLLLGILVELLLLAFVERQYVGPAIEFTLDLVIFAVILIGVVVSNVASNWIVSYVKDQFLWVRVERLYPHPPDDSPSLRDWWRKQGSMSPISGILGVVERIIYVMAGAFSFMLFFTAGAAWNTMKIAVDWRSFNVQYRAIGHIYLLCIALSFLLAGIDVLAVRGILQHAAAAW